jgi:hypothetical protein
MQHGLITVGQPNAKVPLLKATARAGSKVVLNWTPLVRMHSGPIINVSHIKTQLAAATI